MLLPDLPSKEGSAKEIVTGQIPKLEFRFQEFEKKIDTGPHEKCKQILSMTPDQIREEDSYEVEQFDTSRKDSHIKAFENQALGLHHSIHDRYSIHDRQVRIHVRACLYSCCYRSTCNPSFLCKLLSVESSSLSFYLSIRPSSPPPSSQTHTQYMCTHTHTRTHTQPHAHTRIHTHAHTHTHTHVGLMTRN